MACMAPRLTMLGLLVPAAPSCTTTVRAGPRRFQCGFGADARCLCPGFGQCLGGREQRHDRRYMSAAWTVVHPGPRSCFWRHQPLCIWRPWRLGRGTLFDGIILTAWGSLTSGTTRDLRWLVLRLLGGHLGSARGTLLKVVGTTVTPVRRGPRRRCARSGAMRGHGVCGR